MFRFALLLISLISFAHAEVLPKVTNPRVEVIPMYDPLIDFALRIEAINNAKVSVDVVTYLQSFDDRLGKPFVDALKNAIQRGVKVRFLFEWVTNLAELKIKSGLPSVILKEAIANMPFCASEVLCVTPTAKVASGFMPTDVYHEKILIVDGGQPGELAWVGGRNNNTFALQDMDFAMLLKPESGATQSGLSQIQNVFDQVWNEAKGIEKKKNRLSPFFLNYLNSQSSETMGLVPDPKITVLKGFSQKAALFDEFKKVVFLNETSRDVPTFKVDELQVSTNSFFKQLKTNMGGLFMESRDHLLNDNISEIVRAMKGQKKIWTSMMSVNMPKELLNAFKEAIRSGTEIHLITNSIESEKVHVPGGLGHILSSRNLVELMEEAEKPESKGKFFVYALDPSKVKNDPKYKDWLKYLHYKTIITDEDVFIGSDNLNESSRKKNSEVLVRLRSKALTHHMKTEFESTLTIFSPLSCEALVKNRKMSYRLDTRIKTRVFLPFF